jgi:hypothetical protein
MLEVIDKLPAKLQRVIFKAVTEIRYLKFRIKLSYSIDRNMPDPARIYWISPKRIVLNTNYLKDKSLESLNLSQRFFPPSMRGKVIDGDWDITNMCFTDLVVYKSFKKRIEDGVEWSETELYESIIGALKSGISVWRIQNRDDLDNRCKYLDSLYKSIRDHGYQLNRSIGDKESIVPYDEIDVNIGRNGEYLFQNGVHRLSIAKILGIKYVPVMVFARHKKWQDFREYVLSYTKQQKKGNLYQPIVHPDLSDIPYDVYAHDPYDLMDVITTHLSKKGGTMLDIGANIGFYCHKFEDLGYHCYAVENDSALVPILEKIRIAEKKKFIVVNQSILNVKFPKNMKFDVVLALNVFHHFLKKKIDFVGLKKWIKDLKMDTLFFEPHLYDEEQMVGAYKNFTPTEFVDFISQNTSLTKSEVIYTAKDGRTVFKLSK